MRVKLKLPNEPFYQKVAREIRDLNQNKAQVIEISFPSDMSFIIFEGECISLINDNWFDEDMVMVGEIKAHDDLINIVPTTKGKTVNLKLDPGLTKELDSIRNHVLNKTQHEIVLEIFKKGLEEFNKED